MQDATLIEKNRPLAEPSNRRHVVRDEKNRPSFLADVFHLVQAPTLKARITDRQNLIHQQDFGFQVGGYGESEANVHTARVALDGRVEELLDVGEGYDLVELALDLAIAHAQDRSIQVNILSPGQLGMEAGSDFQQGPDTAKDLGSALCRTGYPGETVARLSQRVSEQLPRQKRGVDKDGIGVSIRGYLSQSPEKDTEHDHGQQRLQDRPRYTDRRLFVANLDVSPNQEKE